MLELKLAAPAGFPAIDAPVPWSTIMGELDKGFRQLLIQYQNGLSPDAFFHRFDELIYKAHTDAHYLGQFDAGGFVSRGLARHVARSMADEEAYYLRGFVMDLIDGKYLDGERVLTDRILNRMHLYAGKVRGSASRGFVDGSNVTDAFIWVLGGKEDHCSKCPQLAAQSAEVPFTKATLYQHPGDGNTPCLGNCKCYLVRVRDGETSQQPT